MKIKLIIASLIGLLLIGLIVVAQENLEDAFLSNVNDETKSEVTKLMNSMTPQEALSLRMKQITQEQNQVKNIREPSEDSPE